MSELSRLIRDLGQAKSERRQAATRALMERPGPEVTEALLGALAAGQPEAALLLGWRGDNQAIEGLAAALSSPAMAMRQNARAALVQLKAVEALRRVFCEAALGEARQLALRGLMELKPLDLGDLLSQALDDPDEAVRSLGVHGGGRPRAVRVGDDPGRRLSAVQAMAWRNPPDPTERAELERALSDEVAFVRATAVQGLGRMGWEGEWPLTDESRDVRMAVCQVLTDVGRLLGALSDEDEMVRRAAALRLGELRAAEAVEALLVELARGSWAAARALGEIGDERALEPLIEALSGPVDRVAAEALGRLGDPRAAPALRAYLAVWREPEGWRGDDGPSGREVARASLAQLED